MKRRNTWRKGWPWLAGSLALHVGLLAALPGLDGDERCPVMLLITLQAPAAGVPLPPEAIVAPEPPAADPPPTPRQARTNPHPPTPPAPRPVSPPVSAVQPEPLPPTALPRTIMAQRVEHGEPAEHAFFLPRVASENRQPAVEAPAAAQPEATVEAPPVPAPPPDLGPLRLAYGNYVRQCIGAQQFVPESARTADNRGTTARVTVRVSVSSSGALREVAVTSSSGSAVLDDAAVQAVRRAAPFKPFPAELTVDSVTLEIPLSYRIT